VKCALEKHGKRRGAAPPSRQRKRPAPAEKPPGRTPSRAAPPAGCAAHRRWRKHFRGVRRGRADRWLGAGSGSRNSELPPPGPDALTEGAGGGSERGISPAILAR
jgi:hypothetical protein